MRCNRFLKKEGRPIKKILVLFETSGAVSIPFREAGFEVTTIDILPHRVDNEHHIQYDIRNLNDLNLDYSQYSFLIAFPPCTYFSKAGLHYLQSQPGRKELQLRDLEMVKKLWNLPIKKKCFENPAGSALNKLWQRHNCRIDYCEFADFKKLTDLWLDGLPPLIPVQCNYKKYGKFISKMRYGDYRRCITPIEVGYAMVNQWGSIIGGENGT